MKRQVVVLTALACVLAAMLVTGGPAFGKAESATLKVRAPSYKVVSPIYWRSARNVPQDAVRPHVHYLLADMRYRKLRWQRWGSKVALGRGTFVWDCQISTGNGCRPLVLPMRIRLSIPKTCPDGKRIFGRATARPQGRARIVLRYDCRGRSRGEGTRSAAVRKSKLPYVPCLAPWKTHWYQAKLSRRPPRCGLLKGNQTHGNRSNYVFLKKLRWLHWNRHTALGVGWISTADSESTKATVVLRDAGHPCGCAPFTVYGRFTVHATDDSFNLNGYFTLS
jgi:hypothetical protein